MDIHALKQHIKKDESLIELLLEEVGFTDINGDFKHGDEFRCAWEEDSNPTAVRVNKYSLSANCFSKGVKGDIITLVQEKLNLPLSFTLKKVAEITGFTEEEKREYELPFGGFYKKIHKIKKRKTNNDIQTYSESILDDYLILPSSRFLQDGISYEVQERYKIGYDVATGRIIVPWRSLSGELVGIMGRLNKDVIEEYENKWFPVQAFSKSKTLFGFSENYKSIQEYGFVMLGESEKHPMKLSSMGIDLGLGLGGSSLSKFQANNIKSLFPKKILVCMDEGLDEDISKEIAKQLKIDTFFKNEVGYIYDAENKYLPKGSKMSPSDLPLEEMKKLIMECTRKV